MLLENSIEQFHDIDEESVEDDGSSIEEIKLDENERINQQIPSLREGKKTKKQKKMRNHILIFKNPMELLDTSKAPENNLDSPMVSRKSKTKISNSEQKEERKSLQFERRVSNETNEDDDDIDEKYEDVNPTAIQALMKTTKNFSKLD